jgi:hypothetical protein
MELQEHLHAWSLQNDHTQGLRKWQCLLGITAGEASILYKIKVYLLVES